MAVIKRRTFNINTDSIELLEDGERAVSQTLNRPVKQLIKEINSKFIYIENTAFSSIGLDISDLLVSKISTGVYKITGLIGISPDLVSVKTPEDINGVKFFNTSITLEATGNKYDYVVRTFERVWNPSTGLWGNGSAMDITTGEFISIEFKDSSLG